jgi:hypothetical protein
VRQWIGSHLTFSNVVALAALFVALGGTAMASVIITSNSQVAKDTISGHRPPSGDHPNIITGSLIGQDVANDALSGAKIDEASLTGDAKALNWTGPADANPASLGKVGPYTISALCIDTGTSTRLRVLVNGPAGTVDTMWSDTVNDSQDLGNHSTGALIAANTDTAVLQLSAAGGSYRRGGARTILRSGPALVQLDYEGTANDSGAKSCFVYGTATRAT